MTMFQNLNRSMTNGSRLRARCEACGRLGVWNATHARQVFGPDATPFEIRRRLRCTACGEMRAQVWI